MVAFRTTRPSGVTTPTVSGRSRSDVVMSSPSVQQTPGRGPDKYGSPRGTALTQLQGTATRVADETRFSFSAGQDLLRFRCVNPLPVPDMTSSTCMSGCLVVLV